MFLDDTCSFDYGLSRQSFLNTRLEEDKDSYFCDKLSATSIKIEEVVNQKPLSSNGEMFSSYET